MPDANFEITEENKQEVLQVAYRHASELTGDDIEDWDDFRLHPAVREVWAEQGNVNKVVKTFIFDPILTEPMEEGEVRGFYLGHDVNREYDDDEDEWYIDSEGPKVLFADGNVQYRGNEYDFWAIRNGQDYRDDEDVLPFQTRVVVEGARTRKNLFTGDTEIKVDDDRCKVHLRDHDADIPEPGLRDAIERSMYVAGDHSDRGIIRGDTGDNPNVLAVLTIGTEDDVSFFEANEYNDEDTLRVVAEDREGVRARFKLPIEETNEAFGLDENEAEREVYEQLLSEQPIAVFGRFGVTYTIALSDNEDLASPTPDGPAEVEAALNDVEKYDDAGWMTTFEDSDGNTLKGIDLTDDDADAPIGIGPYDAYDVRQEIDDNTGEKVWLVEVLLSDEDKLPWMDVREHPWTKIKHVEGYETNLSTRDVTEDDERVEEIINSGIANQGAFVCFLNQSGEAFLPESDPFSGKFDDMPGFEEVEDAPTAEADDGGEGEPEADTTAQSPL